LVDKKITKIYTDIKVDKILKQLDKKMSKEEALRKIENLEQIVAAIEKKEK
jgi:acyl carrier protein